MAHQQNIIGGHQQAPIGIVNPTPRKNNKTLSTMDLRLLSTQHHVSNEQKQLFRLSAPLCPQNCMPSISGGGLHNPNGENNYENNRNGSKSNDHFNHLNDASVLFNVPENTINKSKSNMDISSYHRLQQIRMNNEALHSSCTSNKCAFNGQIMNCVKYCPTVPTIHQGDPSEPITQPHLSRVPLPKLPLDNIKKSKFIFS